MKLIIAGNDKAAYLELIARKFLAVQRVAHPAGAQKILGRPTRGTSVVVDGWTGSL